jgi:hypothetical protein
MIPINPDNQVVKLCAEGMAAEAEGRHDDARALFQQAWDGSADDYDACIAAHYLARHQGSPEETLRWNQESLDRAVRVGDDRVTGFYPSLYLNMGHSYEALGDRTSAGRYYDLAAAKLGELPDGAYKMMVTGGIEEGRKRIGSAEA